MASPKHRKKPTAHSRAGRTAIKRPAGKERPGSRSAPAGGSTRAFGLAGRPAVLGGVAVGLLIAGMAAGYLLGQGLGDAPSGTGAADGTAASASAPAVAGAAMQTATLEARLREAQEAPEHQDGTVYPPAITLPGVRLSDRLETWGEPRQPAAGAESAPSSPPPPSPPGRPEVASLPPETPPATGRTVDEGGLPAWRRHAVAVPDVGGRPMVAIVIDDMGVDKRRTALVSALPGPLTTSFLTYAPDGNAQAQDARSHGHELMIHVPMEPTSTAVDPGPGVLRTDMTAAAVTASLDEGLSHYQGYVGINNHMGSKFTADATALRPVMTDLKARGLLWLDSRTTAKSAGAEVARRAGVPFVERNIFLDHQNSLPGVVAQLAKVEAVARKYGYAVAIGHPKDHTIAGLASWLPTLTDKGLALVPLSAIVRARTAATTTAAIR